MLFPKTPLSSSKFSTGSTALKWRSHVRQSQLLSQLSSLLLHHKRWLPTLQNSDLPSELNPHLVFLLLRKTQSHPQISLDFYLWSKSYLPFPPLLKTHLQLIHSLLLSSHPSAKLLFRDPILTSQPTPKLLSAAVLVSRPHSSPSPILSFLLENFSRSGSISRSLHVFRKLQSLRSAPSTRSCNALIDALQRANDTPLLWRFFAASTRAGVVPDPGTWTLLARAFCQDGKLKMVVKLLHSGISTAGMYNLVIEFYSRKGQFSSAMDLLNEMGGKKLRPGFGTYSSILDGACKVDEGGVADSVMGEMISRKLLPAKPMSECDSVIQKLCDSGRPNAAYMFFDRAVDEKIELAGASCMSVLKALSREGRLEEAKQVYGLISQKSIALNAGCYDAFTSMICKEEPTEEATLVLKSVIRRGFLPDALHLLKYLDAQCGRGSWRDVEDLLNLLLEKQLLPGGICFVKLVEHYSCSESLDSAIALHDKVERLGGSFDIASYNMLLRGLCLENRVEEAIKVFDCMRQRDVLDNESYSIIISALCCEKKMRKAMKVHDEMLKKGLKPNDATYKQLISRFA